ncbi:hypothetical protein VTL71DRAFT_15420 [Oculimacula yallundae]|uniref:Uncharacterized protein n=1 Tax=Oculimacula yallundae TaxID=86028 RepID=A0ABR4CGH9_9HELO
MSLPEISHPHYTNLFGDFQFGATSHSQAHESIPESPFTTSSFLQTHNFPPFHPNPPTSPPTNTLASISLRSPKCPQCKTKRFDFTSYFHNARIFRSSPHELLDLIERTYVLKNRLQSILVTYIVNDLREGLRMGDIRAEILDWVRQVEELVEQVREGMGEAEGVESGLESVKLWSEEMAGKMEEHLERSGGLKTDMQKGWKKAVLSEFRREWEIVWIACANACPYRQETSEKLRENSQDRLGGSEVVPTSYVRLLHSDE